MLQYRVNRCVFKSLRKLSLLTLESLKMSGNKFQADGPATEKAPFATGVAEGPRARANKKKKKILPLRRVAGSNVFVVNIPSMRNTQKVVD